MLATRLPLDVIDAMPMAAVLTVVRELQPADGSGSGLPVSSQPQSSDDMLIGRSRGLPR